MHFRLGDLDGDGRVEVLATNHQGDLSASVFADVVPPDPRAGKWTRHTLLTGIETRQQGPQQASPGQAVAFHPRTGTARGRPWILVSGDGSQRVHLLVPESETPGTFGYREEILVPVWDRNVVMVFSHRSDGP